MITIEQLKEKKRALEKKQVEIRAEEKFLGEERLRLTQQLNNLGYKNLAEAKEALAAKKEELQKKEEKLNSLLNDLENSNVSEVAEEQTVVAEQPVLTSIDDL